MVLESVSCTEEDLLFTDAETGSFVKSILLAWSKCSIQQIEDKFKDLKDKIPLCTIYNLREGAQIITTEQQFHNILFSWTRPQCVHIPINQCHSSRQGCHDVLKIWYKDKWYNDVHQGPSPKLPCCSDIFSFIGMLQTIGLKTLGHNVKKSFSIVVPKIPYFPWWHQQEL